MSAHCVGGLPIESQQPTSVTNVACRECDWLPCCIHAYVTGVAGGYYFFSYLGNVCISRETARSQECSIFRNGTQIPSHMSTQNC